MNTEDIQKIVSEAAKRYGLEYNENGNGPQIMDDDGNVTSLGHKDIAIVFGISIDDD